MENTQEQLDPSIIALTKAIGHQESGGKYDLVGDNGHSVGAYQWNNPKPLAKGEIPKNFKGFAHDVGADENDFSPANQDRVAYKTVEKWGKSGLNPAQIASKWNSGAPDTYKNAHPGYNAEQGVHYDVKKYVDNVGKYYQQYQNESPIPNTDSNRKSFADSITNSNQQNQATSEPNLDTTAPGTFIQNLQKGHFGDALQSGVRDVGSFLTGGGSEKLGNELGASSAIINEKIKGLTGGQDNAKYIPDPNVGNAIEGAVGTVAGVGSVAGAGGALSKLAARTPLSNPIVEKELAQGLGLGDSVDAATKAKALQALSREQASQILTNSLKNMPVGSIKGAEEKAILKALEHLNPSTVAKEGLMKGLVKKAGGAAALYGLGATGKTVYDHIVK